MQNNEFQKEIPTNTNNSEPKYDEENEEEKKEIINLMLNIYMNFQWVHFLLIFILNVLYGKKNKKIAFKWYNQNKDFFINNYAHIGTEREFNPKKTDTLIYESYNEYKFFPVEEYKLIGY